MPSSKKRRGRKGKPAKTNGADADDGVDADGGGVRTVTIAAGVPDAAKYERYFVKNMRDVPPEDVVERVRRGMGLTTHLIADHLAGRTRLGNNNNNKEAAAAHARCLGELVDAGLVPTVLSLLRRCEGEAFEDVVEAETAIGGVSRGGRLVPIGPGERMESRVRAPGVWVALLNNVVSAECGLGREKLDGVRMEVAMEIMPLVRCMCDVAKRELFRSIEHWFGAIRPFVHMLYGLAETAETIPLLANYEGLRELMVGCIFWGIHRPDILEESKAYKEAMGPDPLPFIADFAGAFLHRAMKSFERDGKNKYYFEGEGKALAQQIGTTLCGGGEGGIFVSGLIQLLRGDETNKILLHANFLDRGTIRGMLTMLIISGCVDRQFIEEVVDLGLNHTFAYDDACAVAKLTVEMTHDFDNLDSRIAPKDRFVAAAIDAGLVDMLLKFLVQYGASAPILPPPSDDTSTEEASEDFLFNVFMNVQAINGCIMSKHTPKAIESCRSSIMKMLRSPGIRQLCSRDRCKTIIQMLDSVFSLGDTGVECSPDPSDVHDACFNCAKGLSKSEARYCSACKLAKYCSRECQVAHWKLSHKNECNLVQKSRRRGAAKEKVIEMGQKFMEANYDTAVLEMTLRGYEVLDCIVSVDFFISPPDVAVRRIEDHYGAHVEEARQYRAMTAKNGESLGFFFTLADGSRIQHVMMIPWEWTNYQASLRRRIAHKLELCENNPQLREEYIEDVRKRYKL